MGKTGKLTNSNPKATVQTVPGSKGTFVGLNPKVSVQTTPGSKGVMVNVNPKAKVMPCHVGEHWLSLHHPVSAG